MQWLHLISGEKSSSLNYYALVIVQCEDCLRLYYIEGLASVCSLKRCVQNGSSLIGLGGFEDLSDWFTYFIKGDGLRSS